MYVPKQFLSHVCPETIYVPFMSQATLNELQFHDENRSVFDKFSCVYPGYYILKLRLHSFFYMKHPNITKS